LNHVLIACADMAQQIPDEYGTPCFSAGWPFPKSSMSQARGPFVVAWDILCQSCIFQNVRKSGLTGNPANNKVDLVSDPATVCGVQGLITVTELDLQILPPSH